jgi:hypothetical protein
LATADDLVHWEASILSCLLLTVETSSISVIFLPSHKAYFFGLSFGDSGQRIIPGLEEGGIYCVIEKKERVKAAKS